MLRKQSVPLNPPPDEPDARVIEDGPDRRRVFDAADDPHDAFALRTVLTSPMVF